MGLWDSFLDQFRTPFDLQDLLGASAEVLGKGTYGTVYKLASIDSELVVRRLKDLSVPEEEFKAKMEEIGRLDHENLLPLKAFYFPSDEKLLIYDFFPHGSLYAVLHAENGTVTDPTPLKWETRAKIALGTARGVHHIHSQGPTLCHGNIKSSNIFLSKNYEARVSDFGLSQVVNPLRSRLRTAAFCHAPEARYEQDRDKLLVSQKADVYSFGVLLLELLTSKAPVHLFDVGLDLPKWVQSMLQEGLSSEMFDIQLLMNRSVLAEKEMAGFLQLALECTALNPDDRPIMADIATRIERICGCTSNSVKPHRPDPNPKVAPRDLSLPPRKRGSS